MLRFNKVANSFRLSEGGGFVVCKSYCLCLSCFYAVIKLMGLSLLLSKRQQVVWSCKSVERPSLTHTGPSCSACSDALRCYVEQAQLYSLTTYTLVFTGSESDRLVDMSRPEGTSRNAAPRFGRIEGWTVQRWWEDVVTSHSFWIPFILQLVNLNPLQLSFLLLTLKWQMVQRFSWVYY